MQYMVIYKQSGEGCDYTIGCGMKYEILEADDMKELTEEIVFPDGRGEYSIFNNEDISYDEIIVVPFNQTEPLDLISLESWAKAIDNADKEEQQRLEDEAEFERLRKKLGK